ncbi:MAG: hypothetical protein JXB49_27400 [Bacteroidales bacterium]|nr:hypothetical protein [Bacteroidales bacterium]
MKRFPILMILIFSISIVNLKSQIMRDKFPVDHREYIKNLSERLKVNIPEKEEPLLEAYVSAWNTDSVFFSPQRKDKIIEMSNNLVQKQVRLRPHFVDYLQCQLLYQQDNNLQGYLTWEKGVNFILDHPKLSYNDLSVYFSSTINLVGENYIYYTTTTNWKVDKNDFRFEIKDDIRIILENVTLTCFANLDSIKIYEASGYFDPVKYTWYGKTGLVTWERAGLPREEVNAKLENYRLNLTKAEYKFDSVVFTNKNFFDDPLLGVLTDKVMIIKDPASARYPQFESYKKNFFLKDLYEDIDYKGGLKMQGQAMLGAGSQEELAQLDMYSGDTLFLQLHSQLFAFNPDKVSGINTSMTIYLGSDSIYHPDLSFAYYVSRKEVSLTRTGEYTSQSPFYDSYHNLDMNFEQITWKVGETKLYFKPLRGSAIGNANFQSVQLFDMPTYERLQYYDEVHPAVALMQFSKSIESEEFTGQEFAAYRHIAHYQIQKQLIEMAFNGFIFYNVNTDEVKIKPKLYQQIYASVRRIDYDVINIKSTTNAPLENGSLDLRTYDLVINGTPQIQVSNAQNVSIVPKGGQITMKRDRSFQFNGVIDAGLFTFYGSNFFFDYDRFGINLQNVDSVNIRVPVGYDNYGQTVVDNVKNLIEHVTGELMIDDPNNKSGSKNFPEYPIFVSREKSYVYYNDPEIMGGAYKKDEFYFELEPYTIDSLDNFNKDDMNFEGRFVSGGIFPDIQERLKVQPDLSLGFTHKTPESGMPVYKGKGQFFNDIKLSNKGLRGDGKLDYLTSSSYSQSFLFYPDSVNANSDKFEIRKKTTGVTYPMTHSTNNYIHWEPFHDVLFAYQKKEPFTMYNDTTKLSGDLKLQPAGLQGWGNVDIKSAELNSSMYLFSSDAFSADTAEFNLKSLHEDIFTVMADNVKARVDFRSRTGEFTSNEDYTLVEFPENRYISFLDHFEWNMDKQEVKMTTQKQLLKKDTSDTTQTEVLGPKYISIHPDQDSLNFISPLAVYDYAENLIRASEVPYINVADAQIFPFEGNVIIEVEAKMRTLKNARAEMNRKTRYHTIHSARLDVTGRYNYGGVGYYDYIDENDMVQTIFFSHVYVDTGIHTNATGTILAETDFTLSPDFKYQGKVTLFADDPYLTFDGATQLVQTCDTTLTSWLNFKSEINPDYIYIPVPEKPLDINYKELYMGPFQAMDSVHLYPTFFSKKGFHSDHNLAKANGLLYFDKLTQKYKIGGKNKLFNENLSGNFLSYDRDSCIMYGDGDIDFGVEYGQFKIKTIGSYRMNMKKDITTFEVMMTLDFFMQTEAMNIFAIDVDSAPKLKPIDVASDVYKRNIRHLVGEDKAQSMFDDLTLYGEYREVPDVMNKTIVLTSVKMGWNQNTMSYMSYGKIGVGSIGGVQINKEVDGNIEIQKRRSGDLFDIYLNIDGNTWYYFGYTRGVMQTLSSNNTYIALIKAEKTKNRKLKVPKRETPYIYMLATPDRIGKLLRRFEAGY